MGSSETRCVRLTQNTFTSWNSFEMNIEFQASPRVLIYLFVWTPLSPSLVVLRDSTLDVFEITLFCSGFGTNVSHVPVKREFIARPA